MKLIDFINATNGHVTGGANYMWSCFPDGQFMEVSDINGVDVGGCVFNRQTQEVYEVTMCPEGAGPAFLWTNPEYNDAYLAESNLRGVDPTMAFADVKYNVIRNEIDILAIVKDICNGVGFRSTATSNGWPFPTFGKSIIEEADDGEDGVPYRFAGAIEAITKELAP